MSADAVAVGIDVGGTKLVAFAVDEDGSVLDRRRLTSPRADTDALVSSVARAVEELAPGRPLGIGIAGIVSRDGALRYAPNLDVVDLPLRARLREEIGTTVEVLNDATAALVGELHAGGARAGLDVVLLTLGTGVGGAVAAEGQLLLGANGIAGELGHLPVEDGGRLCPCGNRGCLEAYASGSAIGLLAEEALAESDDASSLRDVEAVTGKAVTEAAIAGDELAGRVLDEAGYWLGVGILGLVNIFDPELVLLGGGASTLAAPLLIPVATRVLATRVMGEGHRPPPPIAAADLGDDAGAIGAAMYALESSRSTVGTA